MNTRARALHVATEAHKGQDRKYGGGPYITHPIRVSERVASAGLGADVVAAALLHDVVEDTPVTLAEIRADFGSRVARLVEALTDPPKVPGGPNRAARKADTRARFAALSGRLRVEAHTVKVADLLDNLPSIRANDPSHFKVFRVEARALLEVLTEAVPALRDELVRELGLES